MTPLTADARRVVFSNAAPLSNLSFLASNLAFFTVSLALFGGGALAAAWQGLELRLGLRLEPAGLGSGSGSGAGPVW